MGASSEMLYSEAKKGRKKVETIGKTLEIRDITLYLLWMRNYI